MITRIEMERLASARPWVSLDEQRKSLKQAPKNPSRGRKHAFSKKLTDDQVRRMRETFAVWQEERRIGKRGAMASSASALARQFHTSDTTAREILRGWRRAEAGGPTFDI